MSVNDSSHHPAECPHDAKGMAGFDGSVVTRPGAPAGLHSPTPQNTRPRAAPTPRTPPATPSARSRPRRARPLNVSLSTAATGLGQTRPGAPLPGAFGCGSATGFDGFCVAVGGSPRPVVSTRPPAIPVQVRGKPDFLMTAENCLGSRSRPSFGWLGQVLIWADLN